MATEDLQFMPVDLNPAATEDAARTAAPKEVLRAYTPANDEDLFAPLDTSGEPLGSLKDFVEDNFEEVPPPAMPASAEALLPQTPEPVEDDQPEVKEYEDGSTLTIEKGAFKKSSKWRATLDSGDGRQPEVFYGKTKDEMWENVAIGKLNATKEIRKLNKKIKLGVVDAVSEPEPTVVPEIKALTADDLFQIKTQLESNPDLALSSWFQKKTGLTPEQLVAMASEGQHAKLELNSEAVAKAFMEEHDEYIATDDNYESLLAYLAKNKLGIALNDRNKEKITDLLITKGHWTLRNLNEAFEDLTDAGLLELASNEEPEPTPVQQPQNPRIASQKVGPRQNAAHGSYGLRPNKSTVSQNTETERAPSAEELDNLSTQEISKLFSGVRKLRAKSAR